MLIANVIFLFFVLISCLLQINILSCKWNYNGNELCSFCNKYVVCISLTLFQPGGVEIMRVMNQL